MLARFATDATAPRLYTFDKSTGSFFPPNNVKNLAKERDYYKCEFKDDTNSNAIEHELSKVESRALPIMDEIERTRTMPTGQKLQDWISFVTLQCVRVPTMLDRLAEFNAQIRSMISWYEENPNAVKPLQPRHRVAALVVRQPTGKYQSVAEVKQTNPTMRVQSLLTTAVDLEPLIKQRNWAVFVSESANVPLLCSDNPAILVPLTDTFSKNNWPITFATPETFLIVPISKRCVVANRIDGEPVSKTIDERTVANLNSFIACGCKRFVYANDKNFSQVLDNDQMISGKVFLQTLFPQKNEIIFD